MQIEQCGKFVEVLLETLHFDVDGDEMPAGIMQFATDATADPPETANDEMLP